MRDVNKTLQLILSLDKLLLSFPCNPMRVFMSGVAGRAGHGKEKASQLTWTHTGNFTGLKLKALIPVLKALKVT